MSKICYTDANILAPMVRIGTLPSRLLALDYGADFVYSEETIDFKMLQCERKENGLLGTVDFVLKDGSVVFRTCARETGRVVFQMGTACAKRALKVAQMLEKDVAAIDINMGCPKDFSLKGGMGAALLKKPDKIKEILTALVTNLSIPVTCKIRCLDTIEATVALAAMIETTGVSALGVHGRLTDERPRHKNRNHYISAVAQALTIPVIANGGSQDIKTYSDLAKFRADTGCSAVMVARAAQWNPSIFRPQGLLPVDQLVKAYIKHAIDYDNDVNNCKYCIQQLLREELATPRGKLFEKTGRLREICDIFNMASYYDEVFTARQTILDLKRKSEGHEWNSFKKRKLDDGSEIIELPIYFNKKEYAGQMTPKMILYEHTRRAFQHNPQYSFERNDAEKTFYCSVTYDGKQFASSYSMMSKKWGEQAAAVVCLRYLGIHDGRKDPAAPPHPHRGQTTSCMFAPRSPQTTSCPQTALHDTSDSADNQQLKNVNFVENRNTSEMLTTVDKCSTVHNVSNNCTESESQSVLVSNVQTAQQTIGVNDKCENNAQHSITANAKDISRNAERR